MTARLQLRVQPGASRDRIVGRYGEALKVAVSAPPEKGRANQAVVKLVADALGVAAGSVSVVSGRTGRSKIVSVEGVSQAEVDAWLTRQP